MPSSSSLRPGSLSELPVVRRDIAEMLLSSRFGISSTQPLETSLGPAERSATQKMGSEHVRSPASVWQYAVVDEPQHDLTYKRQLYVAAPIVKHDWRKSLGFPLTRETSSWLPIVFYQAGMEEDLVNSLRIAGIEVIKSEEEARKVLKEWQSPHLLRDVVKSMGFRINDVVLR